MRFKKMIPEIQKQKKSQKSIISMLKLYSPLYCLSNEIGITYVGRVASKFIHRNNRKKKLVLLNKVANNHNIIDIVRCV